MKVFLAGLFSVAFEQRLVKAGIKHRLISFYTDHPNDAYFEIWDAQNVNVFLDSGAFSAWSQGAKVDLKRYIQYIKRYESLLFCYVNLDVIYDVEATKRNQKTMEDAGLHPLPVFHYGSDFDTFFELAENYTYIGIGGMVPISVPHVDGFLARVFHAKPDRVSLHGFGISSTYIIQKYPFVSVDTTAWMSGAQFGKVDTPLGAVHLGEKLRPGHFLLLSRRRQRAFEAYFENIGFSIPELMTDCDARMIAGALYYQSLEKEVSKPWLQMTFT